MNDKEKLVKIRAIVSGVESIKVRCRVTKCFHFDKMNGCTRGEVIIGSNGMCNCYNKI